MSQIDTSTWVNPLPASVGTDLGMILNSLSAWLGQNVGADGSSGGGASASVLSSQSVTLAGGADTSLTVLAPTDVLSVVVLVTAATTASAVWVQLNERVSAPTQIDPTQYAQATTSTSPTNFDPVVLNVTPGVSNTITIHNTAASAVTATATVIGYTAPAGMIVTKPERQERWAWLGWECSNMNGSGGVSPTNVNFIVPITAPMRLLGVNVDFSAAIGNGVSNLYMAALGEGGYYRAANGAPYAIGSNAQNPSGPSAAGFGAASVDSNCSYGPNSGSPPFGGTFFVAGLQASGSSVTDGANKHVDVDCDVLLAAGDGLWFHMAGSTTPSSTTATVDGEMQLAIRYVLL